MDEKKSNKRPTKRTNAQSIETQKAIEKMQPSTNKNDKEQTEEDEKPKRATKQTKPKPTGIKMDAEPGTSSLTDDKDAPSTSEIDAKSANDETSKDKQVEKKSKRGKGKKIEPENMDFVVPVAAPEVLTKKRTLRDRSASLYSDNVQKIVTSEQNIEPITSEVPEKKRRLRDRTASIYSDNVLKPSTSEEPTKSKSRRNADVPSTADSMQPEKKLKSGAKRAADDDVDALAQTPPKKRTLRARTVSKSEENLSSIVSTTKPKAKRGRKAEADVVAEVEEPPSPPSPPPQKRSRNTKKATKDTEVESKSNTKESKAEEKTKRAKKVTEPSDANAVKTPPISTRTRQRK